MNLPNSYFTRILVIISTIFIFYTAFTVSHVYPDSIVKMDYLFSGQNIYSPSILFDFDNETYKMWYSGQQDKDDTSENSKIYYRTSSDNINWSEPLIVIDSDLLPTLIYFGDPSVTKHLNTITGKVEYTMFLSLCVEPCSLPYFQIWSLVSDDGITWSDGKPLISNLLGSAEPSAVIVDNETDDTFWKLYYVDKTEPYTIKMVRVNKDRNSVSDFLTVYAHTNGFIGNPEVSKINNQWHLFFNNYTGNPLSNVSIYKSTSISNELWYGYEQLIIGDSQTSICANGSPNVLANGNDQYNLYFATINSSSDNGCNFSEHNSIQSWTYLTDKCSAAFIDTASGILHIPSISLGVGSFSMDLTMYDNPFDVSDTSFIISSVSLPKCISNTAYLDKPSNIMQINSLLYNGKYYWIRFSISTNETDEYIFTIINIELIN